MRELHHGLTLLQLAIPDPGTPYVTRLQCLTSQYLGEGAYSGLGTLQQTSRTHALLHYFIVLDYSPRRVEPTYQSVIRHRELKCE